MMHHVKTEHLVRKRYKNLSGHSGVKSYALGPSFIIVWFEDGRGYEYNDYLPGLEDVNQMKHLAQEGQGLATYINQNVRENYARRI